MTGHIHSNFLRKVMRRFGPGIAFDGAKRTGEDWIGRRDTGVGYGGVWCKFSRPWVERIRVTYLGSD